jgi:hypothetical protein
MKFYTINIIQIYFKSLINSSKYYSNIKSERTKFHIKLYATLNKL